MSPSALSSRPRPRSAPSPRSVDPQLVVDACSKSRASRSAGSRRDNAAPLVEAGADFLAVCNAVWGSGRPGQRVPSSKRFAANNGLAAQKPALVRETGYVTETMALPRVAGSTSLARSLLVIPFAYVRSCRQLADRRWRRIPPPSAARPRHSRAKPWVAPGTKGSPIDGKIFHAQVLLERGRILDPGDRRQEGHVVDAGGRAASRKRAG